MSWKTNPIMEWWDERTWLDIDETQANPDYHKWIKISDHNRSPLTVAFERIENKNRMVDGTLRRSVVTKKRTWSCGWTMLPSEKGTLLANGDRAGSWMEKFHFDTDGSFLMRLRKGSDEPKATTDASIEEVRVMITDFSKEVTKRGPATDLWSLDLTLEEV